MWGLLMTKSGRTHPGACVYGIGTRCKTPKDIAGTSTGFLWEKILSTCTQSCSQMYLGASSSSKRSNILCPCHTFRPIQTTPVNIARMQTTSNTYIDKMSMEPRVPVSPHTLYETYQQGQHAENIIPLPISSGTAHFPCCLGLSVVRWRGQPLKYILSGIW